MRALLGTAARFCAVEISSCGWQARAEEELRNQLRGEFEQALEQTQKSAEDRVRHIRQEEEIKNRANMESIRRELGGEIDR